MLNVNLTIECVFEKITCKFERPTTIKFILGEPPELGSDFILNDKKLPVKNTLFNINYSKISFPFPHAYETTHMGNT